MSDQGSQLRTGVPILPLRDVVVYPHMVIPLFVGREKSIVALDEAMNSDKQILLVAQKQADIDEPTLDDIYTRERWRRFCSCSSCRTAPSRCSSKAAPAPILAVPIPANIFRLISG